MFISMSSHISDRVPVSLSLWTRACDQFSWYYSFIELILKWILTRWAREAGWCWDEDSSASWLEPPWDREPDPHWQTITIITIIIIINHILHIYYKIILIVSGAGRTRQRISRKQMLIYMSVKHTFSPVWFYNRVKHVTSRSRPVPGDVIPLDGLFHGFTGVMFPVL